MCGNRSISSIDLEPSCILFYRRKLSWFGHVCRHDTLPKIIIQERVDGWQCRGNHGRITWTGQSVSSLLRTAEDRGRWAVIATDAFGGVPQRRLGVTSISQLVVNKCSKPASSQWRLCLHRRRCFTIASAPIRSLFSRKHYLKLFIDCSKLVMLFTKL